jgi:hypothetical protein
MNGRCVLGGELPPILGTGDGFAQEQFACAHVVSCLHSGVLRGSVKVAQPPLQR